MYAKLGALLILNDIDRDRVTNVFDEVRKGSQSCPLVRDPGS